MIADEDHKYRVVLLSPAGDAKANRIQLNGRGKDGTVAVTGDWSGNVTKDSLQLASKQGGKAEMKRIQRKSPTLGQKPPAGAIVLLPFEEGTPTNLDHWNNKHGPASTTAASGARGRYEDQQGFRQLQTARGIPRALHAGRAGRGGATAASTSMDATRSRCSIRSA